MNSCILSNTLSDNAINRLKCKNDKINVRLVKYLLI